MKLEVSEGGDVSVIDKKVEVLIDPFDTIDATIAVIRRNRAAEANKKNQRKGSFVRINGAYRPQQSRVQKAAKGPKKTDGFFLEDGKPTWEPTAKDNLTKAIEFLVGCCGSAEFSVVFAREAIRRALKYCKTREFWNIVADAAGGLLAFVIRNVGFWACSAASSSADVLVELIKDHTTHVRRLQMN